MGARETALNALIACRKEKAWSNGVLKDYVKRDRLDRRDAALSSRLCYGVLQNRLKLDFYLTQLLTGKLKDLHPVVRDILHMGLYQLYEMDMFLGNLIAALEQRGKPTMLIAYGDHLPALNIQPKDLESGNIYKTEYVTWNNFGLEKKDRDLRTYELQGQIMQHLGYNNGNMVKLHQLKSSENSPLSEKEFQRQIKFLAYDMLYGDNFQFGGEKPYAPVDMRMGTLPITVSGLKVMENIAYVQGEGFTTKSKIFVNGKKQKTVMLSQYSLMAKDITLSPGDEITVGQSSSKKEVLSYSNPIIYEEELHLIPGSEEQTEIKN